MGKGAVLMGRGKKGRTRRPNQRMIARGAGLRAARGYQETRRRDGARPAAQRFGQFRTVNNCYPSKHNASRARLDEMGGVGERRATALSVRWHERRTPARMHPRPRCAAGVRWLLVALRARRPSAVVLWMRCITPRGRHLPHEHLDDRSPELHRRSQCRDEELLPRNRAMCMCSDVHIYIYTYICMYVCPVPVEHAATRRNTARRTTGAASSARLDGVPSRGLCAGGREQLSATRQGTLPRPLCWWTGAAQRD